MNGRTASPSQFPSKFGALPQISARNSPEVNGHNQLVPHGGGKIDGLEAEEKIRQLETRINVTEKSNRALLEEVVRLQSELKGNVRRSDELLREERNSRSQLENALRSNNDVMQQLTNRIARAEEKSAEERNAISSLVNHTKSVEQAVLGSQQELLSRRDVQNQKMSELKRELDEVSRGKEALERLSYQLIDEMRNTKNKVEQQQVEFHSSTTDLKNKGKKLEEENRQMLDNMRKQTEATNHTEQSSVMLRQQVETRLSELRDIVVELRNKQDTETQERRLLEQQLQLKVNDLHNGLAEQTRKREEAMHALDVVQREREHAAENERIKLQSKIAEIAEEVSKKILHKEIKLREEATDKFSKIEKFVTEEHDARMAYENQVREDVESRWSDLNKTQDDSLRGVKDLQKMDRQKYAETIQKLDEALNILEEQVDQQRKQNDKLMAAEIKSRKQHEAFTLEKVEDLQEKLSLGITTLQQAVGGVTTQFEKEIKQLKRNVGAGGSVQGGGGGGGGGSTGGISIGEIEDKIEEIVGSAVKNLKGAVDKQLELMQEELKKKAAKAASADLKRDARKGGQQGVDNTERIDELAAEQAEKMVKELETTVTANDEKLQELAQWQSSAKKTLKELSKVKDVPDDMYSLEEKTKKKLDDFKTKLDIEEQNRNRDVENLKKDIVRLSQQPRGGGGGAPVQLGGPSRSDMEAVQTSVRTLAESVQTVKTVLGMKIQTEQKQREEHYTSLREHLRELYGVVKIPYTPTPPLTMLNTPAVSNLNIRPSADGQSYVEGMSISGKPDDAEPDPLIGSDNPTDQPIKEEDQQSDNDVDEKQSDDEKSPTPSQQAEQGPARSPVFLTETKNPTDDKPMDRPDSQPPDREGQSPLHPASREKPQGEDNQSLSSDKPPDSRERPPDEDPETPNHRSDDQSETDKTEQPDDSSKPVD